VLGTARHRKIKETYSTGLSNGEAVRREKGELDVEDT
jgi:hypothetical protein